MRFAVESWAPEYGTPVEAEPTGPDTEPTAEVVLDVETAPARWAPVAPSAPPAVRSLRFVDGVRRVDARVWVLPPDGGVSLPAVAASYAAGVVACADGVARVESCHVRRALFSAADGLEPVATAHATYRSAHLEGHQAEDLVAAVQAAMRHLEVEVALRAGAPALPGSPGATGGAATDLVVVDGPLRAEHTLPAVVGYVKTHHRSYLPPELLGVVARLGDGQRTPLFRIGAGRHARLSWYLRLPDGRGGATAPVHPWAGVVRCEVAGDRTPAWAARVADATAATLPRYATAPHTDARAPQNLHPIAALERHLRHRLGDPQVLLRALRRSAAAAAVTGGGA